jgi:hypothetical protein
MSSDADSAEDRPAGATIVKLSPQSFRTECWGAWQCRGRPSAARKFSAREQVFDTDRVRDTLEGVGILASEALNKTSFCERSAGMRPPAIELTVANYVIRLPCSRPSQFECCIIIAKIVSTQPCRRLSQPECLGAGNSGSANDPTATAIKFGKPSASQ